MAKTSIFKKPSKHSLEFPLQERECAASLNAREHAGEKKFDMGENLQATDFLILYTLWLKYTCVDTIILKKRRSKHSLGFWYRQRECGESLNGGDHSTEKK